jgi:uncharacterized membrane protein YuzA (DUF378 family)
VVILGGRAFSYNPQKGGGHLRKNLGALDWIAMILLIVGGLNWGTIGFFNFDFVRAIFGQSWLSRIVFGLVGLSAIYVAALSTSLSRAET